MTPPASQMQRAAGGSASICTLYYITLHYITLHPASQMQRTAGGSASIASAPTVISFVTSTT